jgi:hypothetical protein
METAGGWTACQVIDQYRKFVAVLGIRYLDMYLGGRVDGYLTWAGHGSPG